MKCTVPQIITIGIRYDAVDVLWHLDQRAHLLGYRLKKDAELKKLEAPGATLALEASPRAKGADAASAEEWKERHAESEARAILY